MLPFPQELEARIPEGQHLFENLLRLRPARDPANELEDLRYRWMLYKSKLKDSGHLLVGAGGKGWGSQEATMAWRDRAESSSFWCIHIPGQWDCSEEERDTVGS